MGWSNWNHEEVLMVFQLHPTHLYISPFWITSPGMHAYIAYSDRSGSWRLSSSHDLFQLVNAIGKARITIHHFLQLASLMREEAYYYQYVFAADPRLFLLQRVPC